MAQAGTDNSGTAAERAELVVLGAGPGGYTAAFHAADLGQKVTLIERYPSLGGVCLNVGCIPSKALLHTAKVLSEAQEIAAAGIKFSAPSIDLDRLRGWKDQVVKQLTGGLAALAKKRGVTVIRGNARFTSANVLAIAAADGERALNFEKIILAAGSRPVTIPGFPDDPRIWDSTRALQLPEVPRRLLVIGGGIIGLEMATVYHALGSEVTVVELADGILPGVDRELVKPLQKLLAKRYAAIHTGTRVERVAATAEGIRVHTVGANGPAESVFDAVLVSVGRVPNSAALDLAKAGVRVDSRGFIPVDPQQRTNIPHIYAIGDLVGQPMLAHKALHEAKIAAAAAAGHKVEFAATVIPSVAYTDPEVAWVGPSEAALKEQGRRYEIGAFPWAASGRALSMGRGEGLTRLLFDADTGRVIGGGIVGANAGELIAEVALAIEMGCDAEDIALTIHPHPTLTETVAQSAEVFSGTITDLYLPKRK